MMADGSWATSWLSGARALGQPPRLGHARVASFYPFAYPYRSDTRYHRAAQRPDGRIRSDTRWQSI